MLKRLSILLTVSFVLLSLFSSCKRSDMHKKQILVLTDLNMNYSSIETIKSSMIKELGKDNYDYTLIGLSNDEVLSENHRSIW